MRDFIPYCKHSLSEQDIDAVTAALRSPHMTQGPLKAAFEKEFAQTVGARHALAVTSGTAALHVLFAAMDLRPDDQVIVPTVTFLSTANAVRFCGAEVIFADVDPHHGMLTGETLLAAISRCSPKKLKAVIPVHLAGQTADLSEINNILSDYPHVRLLEDACHAIGGQYPNNQRAVGSCSDSLATVFSMHPAKTLCSGEGGVITTNDDTLYQHLCRMACHGVERRPDHFQNSALAFDTSGNVNPWYYEMQTLGFNFRFNEMQSALARTQLKQLPEFVEARQARVAYYDELLQSHEAVQPMARAHESFSDYGWHLYASRLRINALSITRAELMNALRARNIGTQVNYIPIHHQPYYRERYGQQDLPQADYYYERTLSLPLYATLSFEEIDYVVQSITEASCTRKRSSI